MPATGLTLDRGTDFTSPSLTHDLPSNIPNKHTRQCFWSENDGHLDVVN